MPVHSIGVDLIEIDRLRKIINRYGQKFLTRIYTENEIDYCSRFRDQASYAARFAAKEAVFKATGLGLRGDMSWKDVEIINDENGKPVVRLYGKTARMMGKFKLHLSLSHSRGMAIAMVVCEKPD